MDYENPLARNAATVAEQANHALEWLCDTRNAQLVGAERGTAERTLRRARRRSQRLARAADAKLCVSVFGPSQAGKSYLVSVLARPENSNLIADYGPDGQLDYISKINPVGEGESTGLVTRFTIDKMPTPPGFPVRLRVLSEADIICVILNSFFMDGDQSEEPPSTDEINQHIDEFKTLEANGAAGLSEEEVWEIRDYVQTHFERLSYAGQLRTFWDAAGEIAPCLTGAKRAEFLSLLWGRHAELTQLYARLAEHRRQLGAGEYVYAPLEAITPRATSIIDVKTLKLLHDASADDTLTLLVPTDGENRKVAVPRAMICALAAEMVLPMRDKPSDFFERTDLLDFPGARNRFQHDLSKSLADQPEEQIPELVLRGKVAYLFDRYVMEQEITSMLLCLRDSNMEVLDLPKLVEHWVALTHGESPAQRRQSTCILFVVLTMFDLHLVERAGGGEPELQFEKRVFSSLIEKFETRDDSWPIQWTPGVPFCNTYWLRNPHVRGMEGLIDYAGEREVAIKETEKERLQKLRTSYLKSENVQRHFADPEAAWDAAMALNDGGVQYLISNLTKVCRPEEKEKQIIGQLQNTINHIVDSVSSFHVAGDVEERLQEKRALAAEVVTAFAQTVQHCRFGRLLSALCVVEDDIVDRLLQAPDAEQEESISREQLQARTALDCWHRRVDRVLEDATFTEKFGISPKSIQILLNEAVHGMRRQGLIEAICEALRNSNFGLAPREQAKPAALICAERINRYVMGLGALELSLDDRPVAELADGTKRPVFAESAARFDVSDLPEVPVNHAQAYWTSWQAALHALFEANAMDGVSGEIDIEQNERVGAVIRTLRDVATALQGPVA